MYKERERQKIKGCRELWRLKFSVLIGLCVTRNNMLSEGGCALYWLIRDSVLWFVSVICSDSRGEGFVRLRTLSEMDLENINGFWSDLIYLSDTSRKKMFLSYVMTINKILTPVRELEGKNDTCGDWCHISKDDVHLHSISRHSTAGQRRRCACGL